MGQVRGVSFPVLWISPDYIILCINLDYVLSLPAEQPDSLKVPAGLYASGLSLVCVCVPTRDLCLVVDFRRYHPICCPPAPRLIDAWLLACCAFAALDA